MKKFIHFASAVIIGSSSVYAQPELTDFGVFDDFSTPMEYNDPTTGRGIYWWGQPGISTLTRDSANRQVVVRATQGEYQYTPFGVSFGDDNGAEPGGVPYTIDLSQNGTWSFDITNYGTEDLVLRVACVDHQDTAIDINPIPNYEGQDFDDLSVWAYQVQIIVPAGDTVTFEAGTPNGAGLNKVNTCDFTQGAWADWGTWDDASQRHIGAGIYTSCDLTKIKGISFTPMNAAKNDVDAHALALEEGHFGISNFKVGAMTQSVGVLQPLASKDFTMFPNPASSALTIKSSHTELSDLIEIIDTVGSVLYSNTVTSTSRELTIDLNEFTSGLYIVRMGQTTQKLMVR